MARRTVREDRQSQWLKGVLDLAVLAALSRETSAYGYTLMASLAEFGFEGIKGGTIYPLLSRLRKDELVATVWRDSPSGPPRRYYALTRPGQRALDDFRTAWTDFADAVGTILHRNLKEQR